MQAETRTVEQVVLGLAEIPCDGAFGHGVKGEILERDPHPDNCAHGCHGTGRKFPMLRKPCEDSVEYGWEHSIENLAKHQCPRCRNRGWLPVTTTDALLEAGEPYQLGVFWNGRAYQSGTKEANTPNLALSLELEAEVKATSLPIAPPIETQEG